jgi:NADH-quinone oxidoreductase subunit J
MILVVVYVGAVAVLFLFVVMMLDVDFAELRGLPAISAVGALVGGILLAELMLVSALDLRPQRHGDRRADPDRRHQHRGARRRALYDYIYFFQAAGLVLLVAMIGAIVLTLRHKEGVKRQDIAEQVARTPETAIEVARSKPGQGL